MVGVVNRRILMLRKKKLEGRTCTPSLGERFRVEESAFL